ncbi:MAG: ABC transporter substrate-binding protein, partial [Chloroflexota bacterium]|nr:ABC transporter substrate-binding protein [Chloroflexota bacterium]
VEDVVEDTAGDSEAVSGEEEVGVADEAETAEDVADTAACESLTPVTLQLQWVTQSQFAGYYAGLDQGFYEEECLELTILEGAVEIVPQQVVAAGDAEFGIAWVPKMLASREQGADLTNIAQVFQRSGTLQVAWADSGIESVEDWEGKRVGTWGFGNEWEVFAALRQAGIEPDDPDQVTIVQQPFDMSLLLNRDIDLAQAETYNEYAQLLEATNPETGELYQPEDFIVFDYNEIGTAMLQDHIFVRQSWLAEEGNEDIAKRFLRASFKGWIFCRDNFDECVNIVLENGPTLGEGHMRWMLNEINDLIWPSPDGIGVMNPELYQQTVDISLEFGVISSAPDDEALRTDLAQEVVAELEEEGFDVRGLDYEKRDVEVTPGGE